MKYFSIILGLLTGYIVIKYYYYINVKYHGPNSKNIINNIYKWNNGKYYKFNPEICICPL